MSGRGWGSTAVSDGFATRHILAGLITLVCMACIPSIASADVDQTGALEKVSSPITSKVGEVKPLNTSANGDYKCIDPYSVIGSKPYYFTIGNCPSGWILEVVSYASENTETHEHSYGGYIGDAYSYCGWIDTRFALEKVNSNKNSACATGSGSSKELEDSEFMEKYDENNSAHDGTYVVNPLPCPEYANYRPWSTNNVEKELIRTAPAYAALTPGSETPALKWRYTTKYSSTDGTGQYVMVRDARVGGTEGNWVFVPRSCLSSTLPPNEGEAHDPLPPAVTTGTPTGVATPNATLVGFVNPHGIDTKYFFEYGTTESYGSYTTTEDAGSGTGVVQENVPISGLAPGTTYYFRIVASSATGEVFGGPVAFTTQPPPAVSTGSASEIGQLQAQLNSSVNPEGLQTNYHFEYGETTSYGSSTAVGNAGAGTNPVSAPAEATGLKPSTTYHFRVVATSSAGTTYGADATFTTHGSTAPAVVRESGEGRQWVYYPTAQNNIEGLYWSSASWSAFDLWSSAPAVAQGTSASAVLESGVGQQWVYYRTTQGNIEGLYWDASAGTWTPFDSWPSAPAAAPGTSPSAVLESGVGQQWVYYQTVQGNIEALYWDASAGKWSEFDMWPSAPAAAPGTSPTAVLDQKTGKQWVYYHTAEGNIEGLYWNNAGTWSAFDYWPSAPAAAPGTSPTMVLESGVGQQWVYYQTAQGNIEGLYWDASAGKWEPFDMWPSAPAAAQGTSPTAVYESGVGQQWVYYHTAQGAIDALYWDASAGKWSVFEPVPGALAAAPWTSPTVIRESGVGQQWVYYVAAQGNIEGLYWDAGAGKWEAFDQWPGAPPA
jgi:uncharacterized cupin superfamily protein